jgi:protein-S-isoprenylcysteine O-methyltransferase Ste14
MFPFRLTIGLGIAIAAAAWINPMPFFGPRHRAIHAVALLVILGGLALRAWGAGSAGLHTRSGQIEAPRLATTGPFAYVRNPIYAGSILLGIGMSLLIGDPLAFVFTALAFAILYFGIVPAEEEFLRNRFGTEYRRYCEVVPRFIPHLRPWNPGTRGIFNWNAIRGEMGIVLVLVGIYVGLLLKDYLGRILLA